MTTMINTGSAIGQNGPGAPPGPASNPQNDPPAMGGLGSLKAHQLSHVALLTKMSGLISGQKDQELAEILNDQKVLEKLEAGILHYKLCEGGLERLEQAISQLQDKFMDTHSISQSMKDLVLKPFAESCTLDAKVAFNILDAYFRENYKDFIYFEQLNQRINQLQAQIQQQLNTIQFAGGLSQFQRQEREQSFQEYDKEMRKVATKIVSTTKAFYLSERRSLLRMQVQLIGVLARQEHQGQAASMQQSQHLIRAKLVSKELPTNLARCLLRCQDRAEFQRYFDGESGGSTSRQELALSLQTEKIELLKLQFSIFFSESEACKKEQLVNMMIEYLQRSCKVDHLTDLQLAHEPLYAANQSTIDGLTQLTCLAMLQLHHGYRAAGHQRPVISRQQSHAWNLLLNQDQLSATTGPVVLCVVAQAIQGGNGNDESVKDMVKELKHSSRHILTITEIINSQVFRSDELQQMLHAFYLVLYGWLKVAYNFFNVNDMDQEVDHIQVLTLRVLGFPGIIRLIWSEVEQNCRNRQKKTVEDVGNQIEIFKPFLVSPNVNVHKFLEFILCLSGNKTEPRGDDVIEMLQNTKVQHESDLLAELIAYLVSQMGPLDRHQLDQDEFKMVEAVLILFAKAIKQNPFMYLRLNSAYMRVTELSQDGHLAYIFGGHKGQIWFEEGSNPFLSQLILALHSLTAVNFEYSRAAVSHLMDAITELYDKDKLVMKSQIVDHLSSFVNQELGGARIVSYFGGVVLEAEKQLRNYKATESYLRFLTKVFKRPYPQSALPDDQLIEFERSLFASSLEQIYFRCMEDYFNTSYIDAASMGKYTTRLLKLTRALLNHFMEVPQSQKASLCEPLPRFDLMLEFLSRILNCLSIDQICMQALELIQVEQIRPDGTLQTRLENKFVSQALKNRQGDSHQVSKLISMAQESIRLLNKMLELAMVDDQSQKRDTYSQQRDMLSAQPFIQDWTSKRCEYIKNLRCVQELSSQVLDPTRLMKPLNHTNSFSSAGSMSISLQSIVAHYILPSSRLGSQILKARALDHLTLTCKLWQSNLVESVRPDMYQLLQGLGSANQVENLFCQQFEQCVSENTVLSLEQCLAWLDLLILAAETQPRFLEMLFKHDGSQSKKQQVDQICGALLKLLQGQCRAQNIYEEQLRVHMKFKLTALLSTIAKKRLCIEFLSFGNDLFMVSLWDKVILEECLKQHQLERLSLNGTYLEPLVELDEEVERKKIAANAAARKATNQCLAKVTICFYLQLLISEYSREPNRPVIRRQITKIFTNEQFKSLSVTSAQISPDVHSLINMMRNLNEFLKFNHEERDRDRQRQNQDRIIARGVDLRDQNESPLHSSHMQEGAIYLKDSLCIDLFKSLEKRQLTSFIVNPGADLVSVFENESSAGQLGCKLYISTKELEYALKSEFYANPFFVAQAISCSAEYNLALSVMLADYLILQSRQEFMVSIGKISLRDSQMSSKAEQLMPLSFLPLVSPDVSAQALQVNNEAFTRNSSSLTKTLISQANSLLFELLSRKRNFEHSEAANQRGSAHMPQNHFQSRLEQSLLSNLVFTLGVISSQLSASKDKVQIDIKSDVQKLVQQDILMRIQSLINIDSCLQDPSMIAQEVSGFIGTDQGDLVGAAASTTTALSQSEKHKYEIFIQLVTQCFQLSIKLKDSEQEIGGGLLYGDRNRRNPMQRAQHLDKQRLDDAYVKVLAQVLLGMQRNFFFLPGLKVFVLAVQIIDNRRDGFVNLMKKQDNQPMKVIIGKLLEKDVTHEEITTILQLLINYSMSEPGAMHLSKLKVLETLFKSNIMQRINEQDLYFSKQLKNQQGRNSMQQVRNPSHIHWCQMLILIRTMNETLLESSQIEQSLYFRDLVQQMHHFKQRIPKVLHVGLQMEAQATQQLDQLGNRSILSMALLEEIELLSAIMQQVFEQGDHWAQLDYVTYSEFKDYTLFSVTKLLEHCNTKAIIPASVTEHHLAKTTQSVIKNNQANLLAGNLAEEQRVQETNAFQLKADITLQKTFLSVTCSLLNILLLSKQLVRQGALSKVPGSSDLLQTWQDMQQSSQFGHQYQSHQPQFHNYSQQNPSQTMMHQSQKRTSGVFTDAWFSRLQLSGQSIVAVAFEFVLSCQKSMKARYTKLRNQFAERDVQDLYSYMQIMFQHDEWVQQEYSGGFNSHMLADANGLADVLDLAETSLQVSGQVSALLLEKVREGTSNDLRFANAQYQFNQASLYQTEEQQVIFLAGDLMQYLGEVRQECQYDPSDMNAQSSSDNFVSNDDSRPKSTAKLDGNYLDKLQDFVKELKNEPGVGGELYYNTGGFGYDQMAQGGNYRY